MSFVAVCCCPFHSEWGFGDPRGSTIKLKAANKIHTSFCGINKDKKHNDRRRKICVACASKIENEGPPEKRLQVEESITEEFEEACTNTGPFTSQEIPTKAFEPRFNSVAVQIPELPTLPYASLQDRRQRFYRQQITDMFSDAISKIAGPSREEMMSFLHDIFHSTPWKSKFGDLNDYGIRIDDKILDALVRDYNLTKDKESAKQMRQKKNTLVEKIKIGDSLKSSSIPTGQSSSMKSRVEAAQAVSRVQSYPDERRRLLSIVANDCSYAYLQEKFGCSSNTITAAKVHAILFGRGGVPPANLRFTRQRVSQEVLESLTDFLHRSDISRPSSCRSVLVDDTETAVHYWLDTVKATIDQYLLEFPGGVKRTYIYTHLPVNFRTNTMLAGLCNICDEYGHGTFDSMKQLVQQVASKSSKIVASEVLKQLTVHFQYFKNKFRKEANIHSSGMELCLSYAFGSCTKDHPHTSAELDSFYSTIHLIEEGIQDVPSPAEKDTISKQLDESLANFKLYLGHLLRTKHQASYYQFVVSNLKPGELVVIIDYKMKLELGKYSRETQRQFYGKRGLSLHGFYVIAKTEDGSRESGVVDLWCEDTKQDSWFTQSALDIGFKWLEDKYPGFSVYLFSDNGPHYHNTGVLVYLAGVSASFNLQLIEYNNFEAGEGKSALDTHFAHVSHKITRWVRVGNDLETGEQLAELVKSLKNVQCLKLIINRTNAPKKVGSLKDISLFGSFAFPTDGIFAGGLVCRSLAGLGRTLSKTRSQMEKLSSSPFPIAGRTGAKTEHVELGSEENTSRSVQSASGPYSVKFIQHADHQSTPVQSNLVIPSDAALSQQPESGFALKQTSGKRALFSLDQKQIMISFYERQASTGVRAEPRDVMVEMQRRGLTPLTEVQIKSWWSTYHQKKKRQMQNLVEEAEQLRQLCHLNTSPPLVPSTSVPVVSRVSTATTATCASFTVPVAMSTSTTPHVSTATTTTQGLLVVPIAMGTSMVPCVTTAASTTQGSLTVPTAMCTSMVPCVTTAASTTQGSLTVPTAMCTSTVPCDSTAAAVTRGSLGVIVDLSSDPSSTAVTSARPAPTFRTLNGVLECCFPPEFSQSSINGRNGSNACTFIALCLGKLFTEQKLPLPVNSHLNSWIAALHYAIVKGNDTHDALFDNDAINLSVQEAVEMAGDEFGVKDLGQQLDFLGASLPKDLTEYIQGLALKKERQCIGIVTPGRTMLFVIDEHQAVGLVDSHQHGDNAGAIIASVPQSEERQLIAWFISMMKGFWNWNLNRCSLTVIHY